MAEGTVIRLNLKQRAVQTAKENLVVPRTLVNDALKAPDPRQALFNIFGGVQALPESNYIHDKIHLETIAYWAPPPPAGQQGGGLSARLDAQWAPLRTRIANLDDTRTGTFTMSAGQFKLVWDRLNDSEFKITRPNEQWSAFIMDLLTDSGKHFTDVDGDLFAEFPEDSIWVK
jgi:hypothetical protein